MKSKNFNKQLSLNKSTISNLNGLEMQSVKGGFRSLIYNCTLDDTKASCHLENSDPCFSDNC